MPVAQPNTKALLADLNKIRQSGILLTNPDEIARLEKAIEVLKASLNGQPATMQSLARYYITLASLRCLTGDFKQVIELGKKGLQLTRETQPILNHVVTLSVAGFFSESRKLLEMLQDYEIVDWEPAENLPKVLINCQSYGIKGAVMDSLAARFPKEAKKILEANQILAEHHITETQVLAMMDLAGEVMRTRNAFLLNDATLDTYLNDKSMTISLPVNLSPDEVAEMEWQYIGEAIKVFPEVPFSSFNIGFSCRH